MQKIICCDKDPDPQQCGTDRTILQASGTILKCDMSVDNFPVVCYLQCCGAGAGAGVARNRIFWPEPDPEP
jgi:hypothetical protein